MKNRARRQMRGLADYIAFRSTARPNSQRRTRRSTRRITHPAISPILVMWLVFEGFCKLDAAKQD